jgi:hypothetical protein
MCLFTVLITLYQRMVTWLPGLACSSDALRQRLACRPPCADASRWLLIGLVPRGRMQPSFRQKGSDRSSWYPIGNRHCVAAQGTDKPGIPTVAHPPRVFA